MLELGDVKQRETLSQHERATTQEEHTTQHCYTNASKKYLPERLHARARVDTSEPNKPLGLCLIVAVSYTVRVGNVGDEP